MEFVTIPTEQTTAATDLVLTVLAFLIAFFLQRYRGMDRFKVSIWSWALVLLAVASKLGAITHGLVMREEMREILWQPLELSMGLSVALFGVGALYDLFGRKAARRFLVPLLGLGTVSYVVMTIMGEDFVVFIVYEAAMIVGVAVIYAILALRERRPGAMLMTAAMGVNLVAAALQTSEVTFRFVWRFDHNGVFHLVQCAGLVVLAVGLRRSLIKKMGGQPDG